jgi:alpha-glucosidase
VPESVFPRPKSRELNGAFLKFEYKENPFSFTIIRTKTREILFDSSAAGLIFEDQYLRLRTRLPENANLYGLGEHSDSLRLKTTNYTRTLWNADTPSIPETWNLYGSHPIYIEHRTTGSHGVFLLSSNGMDVVIHKDQSGQYLEYNVLGGVFDLYFMAGPSPIDVAKQYSEIAGLAVTVPYAGLGFHQCRWGYRDVYNVAEVVYNYSKAGIPLETMWTDIDYMDGRAVRLPPFCSCQPDVYQTKN